MGSCVIVCAGGFDGFLESLGEEDLLLAADGGFAHIAAMGLTPDGVLGDFDSLGYVPEKAKIFPVQKDDTDAMLAVRQGLRQGYKRFLLYGSLDGPRLDHTVANFQTLRFLAEHGAVGYLVGKTQLVTVVKNGTLCFPAHAQGILSVFSMDEAARGVSLEGLQYPLENRELRSGFPLGVSNHFVGKPARITVTDGCLLVIWQRQLGLPMER